MMNVIGIRNLLILTCCALALSGCEEPDVSMASLGKKLQAPSLSSASPFDQDMDTNGYVRFQGSCNPRVEQLFLSLDETLWFQVPAVPNATNTTLTGTEVNDASCETDGHFDFYLTKNDLISWSYDPDDDVPAIFLRGTTAIGDSHILTIKDTKTPGSGNGGNSGVAAKMVLEKTFPMGTAGTYQCEYFNATVRDANNYFVTVSTPVTFTLDKEVDSVLYPNISAYATYEDCQFDTNSKTAFAVPIGKNSVNVYYKFSNTPINQIMKFRVNNVSLATTVSPYVDVLLRDSASGYFWVASHSPYKVGKGMCTKGNFEARFYNGSVKSLYLTNAWTPTVTGTNASKLYFYSDANCTTRATAIDGTAGNNTFYFKYTGTETETSNLSLTINHALDASFGTDYDDIAQKIEIDRSGNTTFANFDFYVNDNNSRGLCSQTQLNAYNNQGTLVTPNNVLINFASSNVSGGALFYATQGECDNGSNPITSLTVASPQTPLFFKTFGAPSTSQTFTFTGTGLPAVTRSFLISNKATTVTARFDGQLQFTYPSANVCTNLKIDAVLGDTTHDGTTYINNFNESKYINVTIPSGYTLYTDPACSAASGGNSMGFVIGAGAVTSGQFNFYIKANSTPSASVFSVMQSTGGAAGYLMPTSPGLVIGP